MAERPELQVAAASRRCAHRAVMTEWSRAQIAICKSSGIRTIVNAMRSAVYKVRAIARALQPPLRSRLAPRRSRRRQAGASATSPRVPRRTRRSRPRAARCCSSHACTRATSRRSAWARWAARTSPRTRSCATSSSRRAACRCAHGDMRSRMRTRCDLCVSECGRVCGYAFPCARPMRLMDIRMRAPCDLWISECVRPTAAACARGDARRGRPHRHDPRGRVSPAGQRARDVPPCHSSAQVRARVHRRERDQPRRNGARGGGAPPREPRRARG